MIHTRLLALATCLLCPLAAQGAESIQDRFQGMDANHDGRVDAVEHAAAAQAMFKQLDADLDGAISAEELRLARKAMDEPSSEEQARQAISAMDRNGDGKVDADEHLAAATALFQRTDGNHDGAVTLDEMQRAAGPAAN
jgi:Ca2+-binding EF-hand superfamily protein